MAIYRYNGTLFTQKHTFLSHTILYFRNMIADEQYMFRCIELAKLGQGFVAPNPMVGCVIVVNHKIIAEGWHKLYGKEHAEVNAIESIEDKSVLNQATVYVNLEPCSHFGKTPPCANLLVKHKVKKVVIGMLDPYTEVSGNGIEILRNAGIEVVLGVLKNECEELNKRFLTYHLYKRPFVVLKWAQTANGFFAPKNQKVSPTQQSANTHITGPIEQVLVHKMRSQESAILIGANTALLDNPVLNTRAYVGLNPLRIVIDKDNKLPKTLAIFDGLQPTLVFIDINQNPFNITNVTFLHINFAHPVWPQVLDSLYKLNIQSVLVEGGAFTLQHILNTGLWDEAFVFNSSTLLDDGIIAPQINGNIISQSLIGMSNLTNYIKA